MSRKIKLEIVPKLNPVFYKLWIGNPIRLGALSASCALWAPQLIVGPANLFHIKWCGPRNSILQYMGVWSDLNFPLNLTFTSGDGIWPFYFCFIWRSAFSLSSPFPPWLSAVISIFAKMGVTWGCRFLRCAFAELFVQLHLFLTF